MRDKRDKRESDNVGEREVMRSLAKSCWAPELTGRLLNVGGKLGLAWPVVLSAFLQLALAGNC